MKNSGAASQLRSPPPSPAVSLLGWTITVVAITLFGQPMVVFAPPPLQRIVVPLAGGGGLGGFCPYATRYFPPRMAAAFVPPSPPCSAYTPARVPPPPPSILAAANSQRPAWISPPAGAAPQCMVGVGGRVYPMATQFQQQLLPQQCKQQQQQQWYGNNPERSWWTRVRSFRQGDYGSIVKLANAFLDGKERRRRFMYEGKIFSTIGRALADLGRPLDKLRIIGTGTISPPLAHSPQHHKGSSLQVALALRIATHFTHRQKRRVQVFYQEMEMGAGEADFWRNTIGARVLEGPSEMELSRVPAAVKQQSGGGVTLVYMIGPAPGMLEEILEAYRPYLKHQLVLISDNIKEMDDSFLRTLPPGLNFSKIIALRRSSHWRAANFPQGGVARYFRCQTCNYHTTTAIQWMGP